MSAEGNAHTHLPSFFLIFQLFYYFSVFLSITNGRAAEWFHFFLYFKYSFCFRILRFAVFLGPGDRAQFYRNGKLIFFSSFVVSLVAVLLSWCVLAGAAGCGTDAGGTGRGWHGPNCIEPLLSVCHLNTDMDGLWCDVNRCATVKVDSIQFAHTLLLLLLFLLFFFVDAFVLFVCLQQPCVAWLKVLFLANTLSDGLFWLVLVPPMLQLFNFFDWKNTRIINKLTCLQEYWAHAARPDQWIFGTLFVFNDRLFWRRINNVFFPFSTAFFPLAGMSERMFSILLFRQLIIIIILKRFAKKRHRWNV